MLNIVMIEWESEGENAPCVNISVGLLLEDKPECVRFTPTATLDPPCRPSCQIAIPRRAIRELRRFTIQPPQLLEVHPEENNVLQFPKKPPVDTSPSQPPTG